MVEIQQLGRLDVYGHFVSLLLETRKSLSNLLLTKLFDLTYG